MEHCLNTPQVLRLYFRLVESESNSPIHYKVAGKVSTPRNLLVLRLLRIVCVFLVP